MKAFLFSLINRLLANNIYTIRRGIASGLKRKGGLGFIPNRKPLTKENYVLKQLDYKNKTVYDIGANIGIFTLFFANEIKPNGRLISFEPNPFCFQILSDNVGVNGFSNVTLLNFAVGRKRYKDKFAIDRVHTGAGSLNPEIKSKLLTNKTAMNLDIDVFSIDFLLDTKKIAAPDFIKIDVEGLEYDVLQGMISTIRKYRPQLFIEIHGATAKEKVSNIIKIVEFLENHEYAIRHIETNQIITKKNASDAKEGHIYCQ